MSQFLFSKPAPIPELSEAANLVVALFALCERLSSEERTKVMHADGRAENVAEHSLALVKVAVRLAEVYYPELDCGKVAMYAADHDDVEAYVGDTPTDVTSGVDLADKSRREKEGLDQLVREYASISLGYANNVQAYEKQDDPESRFVRMVDKVIVHAIHFFDDGQIYLEHFNFDDFVNFEITRANNWTQEYPEYADVIALRTEMTMYLARKYLKS